MGHLVMSKSMKSIRGSEDIKIRAKELRKQATAAEKILWEQLRNRKLNGIKFRRQHVLSPYIVDFYCPTHQVAIELDGEIHKFHEEDDIARERNLEDRGIRVIRFWNYEVEQSLESVLEIITNACRHPSPTWGRRTEDEGSP
jgi:very-short-patch-repair endonuclease